MAFLPLVAKDGNGVAQNMQALQDASGNNIPLVSLDSNIPTYRASASFVPVTASALQLFQIQGSATKTVRVRRILMTGYIATANATITGYVQRCSTAGVTGTAVLPTIAKMDTNFAAATAVVTHFTTAAQTVGTLVGGPLSYFTTMLTITAIPTVGAPNGNAAIFPEVGTTSATSLVLRGTADFISVVNAAPASFANAPVLQYTVEWTEDNS